LPILQEKQRADERTRTADLTSLRVRFEAFLGIARTCKTRLDKLDSYPSFAYHCT
jgi:hypothetical protein